MTEYSKYPGYIDFEYSSAYSVHHMQLKTKEWNPAGGTGGLGSYEAWDASTIGAEAMIDAMVDVLKPFFLGTTSFDAATIYTLSAVGSPAIPRAGKVLSVAGTSTESTQAKAVQETWTFRDVDWGICRIVMLDAPTGAGFEPITDITGVTEAEDLVAEFTAVTNAWASPADGRPATFRRIVYTLNDGLRRQYDMT
jgi:hypothetical protein